MCFNTSIIILQINLRAYNMYVLLFLLYSHPLLLIIYIDNNYMT